MTEYIILFNYLFNQMTTTHTHTHTPQAHTIVYQQTPDMSTFFNYVVNYFRGMNITVLYILLKEL